MYQPVVIIGAARSGTNMLRDILTQLPHVGTWPCDEINYIWRHGNARFPTDEFGTEQATPAVRSFIQKRFSTLARRQRLDWVVEKTCANSLRVAFVDRVLPGAKFLFLVRDGCDVIASAMKRWTAALDWRYVAKKARYVPPADAPYYATRYLADRVHRLFSAERRLRSWGPRFAELKEVQATCSLPEVCAAQWARSVERSLHDFVNIDPARVLTLRYEQFVSLPHVETLRILDFLGIGADADQVRQVLTRVSNRSVGNWRQAFDDETLERIIPLVRGTLERLGYLLPSATDPVRSASGGTTLPREAA